MNKNYSLLDVNRVSKDIIKNSKYKILLFHGEMGVGKTTFVTINIDEIDRKFNN